MQNYVSCYDILCCVIQCSGLHKPAVETAQSSLAADGVFDNNASEHNRTNRTVDISLDSSLSMSSCVNSHQGQMSYNAARLVPGPPSSKICFFLLLYYCCCKRIYLWCWSYSHNICGVRWWIFARHIFSPVHSGTNPNWLDYGVNGQRSRWPYNAKKTGNSMEYWTLCAEF